MPHDDDEDMGEKLVASPDFDGPTGHRHCTDILCSILLIASWVAMTVLGLYAVKHGDYRIVLYPLDYNGNICGTDFAQNMTEYPYLYYINNFGGGVCMKSCPVLTNLVANNLTDVNSMITYGGLFLTNYSQVNAKEIQVANYSNANTSHSCTLATCIPNPSNPAESWTSQGVAEGFGYAYFVADSFEILQRCTVTSAALVEIGNQTQANSTALTATGSDQYTKFWNELYADMYTARAYVLGFGFGVAVVVSFGYIFLLRMPLLLSFAVWGSIFVTIAMFFATGYYAYNQSIVWAAETPRIQSNTTISATKYASYALFAIGAILFLLLICLRKQIQLAIGCVKEAGKAISRMPLIVLVPVVQATGFIAFMVVFTVYGVYLASLAKIVTQQFPLGTSGLEISVRQWQFSTFVEQCGWYLLFCLYWYVLKDRLSQERESLSLCRHAS